MFRHYSFVIFVCVIISAFLITYEISPETEIHDDVTVQETVKSVELKPKYLEIQAGEILIKSYDREQAISAGDVIGFSGRLMSSEYYVQKYQNRSYTGYLKSRNISYICYPKKLEVTGHEKGIYSARGSLISAVDRHIDRLYRSDAPVFKALFYGDRSELSEDIKTSFSRTGTAHILALSGFHTGIVLVFINILLIRAPVRKRGFAASGILLAYAFLTGLRPSIIRAVAFFIIYYVSFIREERYSVLSSALLTASVMAAVNPYYIYDAGFQLSFASVISIAMFMPLARRYSVPSFMAVTLSAQILTLPIVVYSFGVMPIFGLAANFAVIPLISLAMALFLVSMIFYAASAVIPFAGFFAKYISQGAIFVKDMLIQINHMFERLPYSYMENLETEIWKIALYYVIILLIYRLWEIKTVKENIYELEELPKIIA